MKLTHVILSVSIFFLLITTTIAILASNIASSQSEFIEQAEAQNSIINAVNENAEINIEQYTITSTKVLEMRRTVERLNEKSERFQRQQEDIINRIGRLKAK